MEKYQWTLKQDHLKVAEQPLTSTHNPNLIYPTLSLTIEWLHSELS